LPCYGGPSNWKAGSLEAFARDAASAAFNVQKVDPRRVGVASILKEVVKLRTLTAPQLPEGLFSPCS
jgi:hypothetical protein